MKIKSLYEGKKKVYAFPSFMLHFTLNKGGCLCCDGEEVGATSIKVQEGAIHVLYRD